MYILLNWFLKNIPNIGIIAIGNVINNPKFPSGENIFTSKIKKVSIDNENKQFIFITNSGSNYIAKFSEINIKLFKDMKDNFEKLDIPAKYLNICQETYNNNKHKFINYIYKILNPNELYIKIASTVFINAFFMTNTREIKEIPIKIHLGMFEDSILITDFHSNYVDIRFWKTNCNTISPYTWSKNLNSIKIYNIGDDVTLNNYSVKTILKHNLLTEIKKDNIN